MNILIPILILTSIGTISGIGLGIISNIMSLVKDKKLEKILEVLPGANCGACGFSGCESYAKALSEGKAKLGLCIPGGKSVSDKLNDILGSSKEP
ncbi:MAG: RnfABCDGE type electron transport complex subunit B [Clostridia bacterium]|nr:RnfABCDGE type electron transport complex subunit B [Clostridia bacterium]